MLKHITANMIYITCFPGLETCLSSANLQPLCTQAQVKNEAADLCQRWQHVALSPISQYKKKSFQVKNCLASLQAEQHSAQNCSEIAPVTLLPFYSVGEYFPINYFYGKYLHTIQFPPLSIRFLCP